MARPIAATPELKGKEATSFITKIHENANKTVGIVPTPKLENAQKLIERYSINGKKHIR